MLSNALDTLVGADPRLLSAAACLLIATCAASLAAGLIGGWVLKQRAERAAWPR